MPSLDLGDVTIHYEEAGAGPLAYVFCHGLGQGGESFAAEFDFWERHFGRVVTWDNRGIGRSSPAAKYSLPLYADDLARLLEKIGVAKAVVHGVSWGGVVALQFGLDHLERCAALVIDSSSSEVNRAASERWRQIGESARQSRRAFEKPLTDEQVESFVASARTVAGLREHPLTPRLKHITCPVLVIAGAKDEVTAGPAGSVIMSHSLPNAELHILPEAGHAVYARDPEGFRRLVLQFCRARDIIA